MRTRVLSGWGVLPSFLIGACGTVEPAQAGDVNADEPRTSSSVAERDSAFAPLPKLSDTTVALRLSEASRSAARPTLSVVVSISVERQTVLNFRTREGG